MSSNHKAKTNQRVKKVIDDAENLAKVLQLSKAMQKRFKLIPRNALNRVTVAGIRDMSMGRVKDGKPIGMSVFSFQTYLRYII